MKKLHDITPEEAKHIAFLLKEPFLNYMTNNDGKWEFNGLAIQISTTSTINGDVDDSVIWIKYDGTISLWRNNGNWNGSRFIEINTVPIIDYLRSNGYDFKYK